MNGFKIDLSKYIDNFKIDKDKAKQYGGYKKIATDLSKENIKLAFENTILQSKIDKAIDKLEYYNSGEALYYVPIQDIIDILKEDK
jgi:hypothetical protein